MILGGPAVSDVQKPIIFCTSSYKNLENALEGWKFHFEKALGWHWGGLGAALGSTWAHLGPLSGKSFFKNGLWNLDLAKSTILPKVLHGYFLAAEAHMSRHAEIGRRYHSKWGSPCKSLRFL